tara:strand:- start:1054 stop:1893 length:840 start_codon:yes stop_codon:yes gene_type:complete
LVNFTSKKLSFENKLENLKEFISNYTSAIIAYSGGIDSSLIAQLANNVLGKKNTLVVIAVSPSLNNKEFKLATNLAKMNNWNFKPIYTQEFSNDNYLKNDLSRCFYCKFELYEKLEKIFEEEEYQAIFNGTNFDDLGDFRPGLDAAKKKNIVSPLVKCKINKNEVRQIAKLIGLPNWDKPAQPCLSSRVPYGVRISMDNLKKIERSENFLSDLGFLNFRVRMHGDLAKIEVSEDDFVKFSNHHLREKIIKNFKKFGFKFVSLDLKFFSSGNLSRAQIDE